MRFITHLASTLAALSLASPGSAQGAYYEIPGDAAGEQLGQHMEIIGDIDGDGHRDILVGLPMDSSSSVQAGCARVYSGADGTLVYNLCGQLPGDHFGSPIAALGDVDGDGVQDFLVGAKDTDLSGVNEGSVYIYTGATGSLLYQLDGQYGISRGAMISIGDLDGDLMDDWMAVHPEDQSFGNGSLRAYSGATGVEMYGSWMGSISVMMSLEGYSFIESLVSVPDANGDGIVDAACVLYGGTDLWGVVVVSGADGSPLSSLKGFSGGLSGPQFVPTTPSLAALGDFTGDGQSDIGLGSPFGGTQGIQVSVRTAATCINQQQILQPGAQTSNGHFVGSMDATFDVDGDGVGDLLLGCPRYSELGNSRGRVYVRSGTNTVVLESVDGTADNDQFGAHVGFLGDLDGDGRSEYAVSAPTSDINGLDSGLIRVFGGCQIPAPSNFCSALPNSTGVPASISSLGEARVSLNNFILQADAIPALQNGLFFYGPAQVSLPLGNGTLCVGESGGVGLMRLPIIQADVSGHAAALLDFTQPPASVGLGEIVGGSTWNFQFWYRDPASGGSAFNLSDGLSVTFCP